MRVERRRVNRENEPPRNKPKCSGESETCTLVSEFVAKELKALKKDEKKEE